MSEAAGFVKFIGRICGEEVEWDEQWCRSGGDELGCWMVVDSLVGVDVIGSYCGLLLDPFVPPSFAQCGIDSPTCKLSQTSMFGPIIR